MGKNPGKPTRAPRGGGGGGGGGGFDEDDPSGSAGGPALVHSKEFEQAELDRLLNPVERLSWEEFKEQQRKKGEMEGKEAREEEEAQKVGVQKLAPSLAITPLARSLC